MKQLLLIGLLAFMLPARAQHNLADSLRIALKKEKTDTGKAIVLYDFSIAYQIYKPDSALLLAEEAYYLSTKHHFLKGQSWALNQMGGSFLRLGNYSKALEYFIRQLKIEEQRGFADNIASVNMNIALVYNRERDSVKAISYILRADSIIQENKIEDLKLYALLNTGDIYEKAGNLPLALSYTRQCYEEAVKKNDSLFIGSSLNNLGNIYAGSGDFIHAIAMYSASIPFSSRMGDNQSISESTLGLANTYYSLSKPDSAMDFARRAYLLSNGFGFVQNALHASELLSKLFKDKKQYDSSLTYHEIMVALKDSIGSEEKSKQIENMSIAEQLRQKELQEIAEKEKEELRQKLQLLGIGIAIPVFVLMSFYISRKRVHRKVIQFFGIVSLLLFFEYITLLIHPLVAELTHHSPVLEIIIFVCIAAMIIPAHHKIENWFIKRLTLIHEKHATHPVKEELETMSTEMGDTNEPETGEVEEEETVEEKIQPAQDSTPSIPEKEEPAPDV